jgi:hypothetical protein
MSKDSGLFAIEEEGAKIGLCCGINDKVQNEKHHVQFIGFDVSGCQPMEKWPRARL